MEVLLWVRSNRGPALGAMYMMSLLCINDSVRGIRVVFWGTNRGSASGTCQFGCCLGREAVEALLRVQWTRGPSRLSLFCVDNDSARATHAGCSTPIEVVPGARAKRKRGSASGARQSRFCLRRQSALGTRPARFCLGCAPIRGSASGARQVRFCLGHTQREALPRPRAKRGSASRPRRGCHRHAVHVVCRQ